MQPEITSQGALEFLGMGEPEARRAASTILMIRSDPFTKLFLDAIDSDIFALMSAIEYLHGPVLIAPGLDNELAKQLALGPARFRASSSDSLRRLKDRLPAVADWYGPENEARAQRVMSLYRALSYLLYWI